jgi:hypothetical protein
VELVVGEAEILVPSFRRHQRLPVQPAPPSCHMRPLCTQQLPLAPRSNTMYAILRRCERRETTRALTRKLEGLQTAPPRDIPNP